MGIINVDPDKKQLDMLKKAFQGMETEMPKAIKTATNDTAKQARKKVYDKVKKVYATRPGGFNKAMKMSSATTGRPVAILSVKSGPLPLILMGYKGSKTDATRAKVYRISEFKKLEIKGGDVGGKDLKAFLAIMKSGHRGIFRREPGRYMKGKKPRALKNGRRTRGREGITEYKTVSFAHMAGNQKEVLDAIEPDLSKDYEDNVRKQISRILAARKSTG